MTVAVTSLRALLDDTHNPQQLQLGNGKCLNRTAQSSSPGSTAPGLGCHSSVRAHLSSLHLPQPGDGAVVQTAGRCGRVRMTTSLLNGSRLPARHPARSPVSQHRREGPTQANPLGFPPPCTARLPKLASPKARPRLCAFMKTRHSSPAPPQGQASTDISSTPPQLL